MRANQSEGGGKMKKEYKSRFVSAGFLASEITAVTETTVYLTENRQYNINELNGRELDEVREYQETMKELNKCN